MPHLVTLDSNKVVPKYQISGTVNGLTSWLILKHAFVSSPHEDSKKTKGLSAELQQKYKTFCRMISRLAPILHGNTFVLHCMSLNCSWLLIQLNSRWTCKHKNNLWAREILFTNKTQSPAVKKFAHQSLIPKRKLQMAMIQKVRQYLAKTVNQSCLFQWWKMLPHLERENLCRRTNTWTRISEGPDSNGTGWQLRECKTACLMGSNGFY